MLGVVRLAGADGLDVFGGYPTPYLTGGNLCVLEHQGTGGDNGALAYLAAVEQRAAHADESVVVDGTSVDGDVMADGDIAADVRRARLVGDMDAGAVLHVGAVADGDGCHVAPDDGIEPHAALVAHGHIADDGSILAEIAVTAPLGTQTAVTLN